MKNIYIIPTDKPSRLMIDTIENKLYLQPILHEKTINVLPQHIYITNSEEIKEGDYFIENGMYVSNGSVGPISDTFIPRRNQKIILTTDQDLIKDGVQSIDDEFLEWFVKNPNCGSVDVNDWLDLNGNIAFGGDDRYQISCSTYTKITTSQEESKYITVKEPCIQCGGTGETTFSGTYTTQRKCDLCNGKKYWNKKIPVEEPKQDFYKIGDFHKHCDDGCKYHCTKGNTQLAECLKETLEEAAEIYASHSLKEERQKDLNMGFKAGAKWQAERMYSEGDKIMKFLDTEKELKLSDVKTIERIKWYFETYFEQFKKK